MAQKQAKKRNNVMAIKIGAAGAGSFGVGGIVLFGGALVTATLVSVFAIKATQKRRRRPEPPSPSPAVADEDGRDHHQPPPTVADNSSLELMMKNRKDRVLVFTKDSSSPSGNYDETSEMGINRKEPTSISILDENSRELRKESMEEEVLVIRDDQNGEIFDEIYPESGTETGEECEDHGGDTMEEKCEELGITQVVAAGEEEIQEPSLFPVLGDGSSDNRRCGTSEQPPMILVEPIGLVLKHNGEVVAEKEETLFGNAGDVIEGDNVGICLFGDNQETVANNHEEGGLIQEAVVCVGVNGTKVEDNPPSSDVQLLEEEEDYIEENREGDDCGDLTLPEKRENELVDSGFTDQIRGDEEEEQRQRMQEEVYGKALSVALIDGIEEEARAVEATSSDQIPVEENGLEIHMVDEEKGEEGEIDEDEQQAQSDDCDDKPISAENLALPLLESELLPGYGMVSAAITADSSLDKGEIIEEDDDILQHRLVEKEETDRSSEIQPSEEEDVTDSSVETGDTSKSMMPNIKHTEADKPMKSDEIANASDGNIIEGKKDYDQKPATSFEQRYISKDPWVVRTWTLSMMVPLWCLCHWYFDMPLMKLGLAGTIMFFCVVIIGFPKPMLLAKK